MFPRLTKRERELAENQTLEQFKEKIVAEARKRLAKHGITAVCITHLREVTRQEDFDHHVNSVVDDSIVYR